MTSKNKNILHQCVDPALHLRHFLLHELSGFGVHLSFQGWFLVGIHCQFFDCSPFERLPWAKGFFLGGAHSGLGWSLGSPWPMGMYPFNLSFTQSGFLSLHEIMCNFCLPPVFFSLSFFLLIDESIQVEWAHLDAMIAASFIPLKALTQAWNSRC